MKNMVSTRKLATGVPNNNCFQSILKVLEKCL